MGIDDHTSAAVVSDATTAPTVIGNNDGGIPKQGSRWSRFHRRVNKAADNFFYRLGYWVATHPKLTLLICLVLVIACCSGFVNFEIEADGEDLWVPANSLSKEQEEIVDSFFDDSSDYAVILMDSPSDDGNILTKVAMDKFWELNNHVTLDIETNGKVYQDLCLKQSDDVTCEFSSRSLTRFWGDSYETYQNTTFSDSDVLEAFNVENFPDGEAVSLEAIFGNTIEYNSAENVTSAKAMTQIYLLNTNTDEADEDAFEWMAEFQDFMEENADEYESVFRITYITSRSIDDALEESVSGDISLFVATYIIMVLVASIAVGRCGSGKVRRRGWLGVGGVLLVVIAGLAAYGINSGFGIPFTTLSQILPFILVGIGVDDMFVIVAAYDHTAPTLPVEERVATALKRTGVSITYTSLTNFFAFMLGSTTTLPAVEYFCLYAGTAILFDFFLQLTAFVAFLTMDANRQKEGRIDCCCCFKSRTFLDQEVQRGVVLPPNDAQGKEHVVVHELGMIGRFMKDVYTPLILSIPGKVVVLLGTVALLASGIYGVTQATQGFDVLDLAPDDHYARDYTTLAREYELDIDSQYIPVGVYTLEVDYTDVDVQVQMQETDALMEEQRYISGPIDSWLSSFLVWASNSTTGYSAYVGTSGAYSVYEDPSTFYVAVAEFIDEEDNERFQGDIAFKDDNTIEISRSWLFLVDVTDTESSVDALKQTRDVVDQSTLDPEPFGYSGIFIFTEQFLVIYEELIINFVLALVAVAVLSLFILGKVGVVALVCFTVVIIDIDLLGYVYYWDLDVNSITVIELIMAVGLVVDYMVHIVHFFLHQDPNIPKDARIADALGEIGPSVMLGAATTFLGIMPLAFANNVIFRVFFKMFLIIITFGFFHGAVFMPVALSILPDCCVSQSQGNTAVTPRKRREPRT